MTNTTRAVLFSMLLCPGGGHLFLRRWWRGSLFVLPFVLGVGYHIFYTVDNTIDVINMVMSGGIEADQKVIEEALNQRLWKNPSTLLKADRILLVSIWVLAAIDVFFLSRRLEARKLQQDESASS